MKKIILINTALVALAMLVSCQKESVIEKEVTVTGVTEFTATIAQTKTAIASNGKVTWAVGDEITVTDADSKSAVYVSQYEGASTRFTLKDGETAVVNGPFAATYGDIDNQVYDAAGANCPLTAESSTEDFIFSSPYAVVKITAKSDNAEVIKSVVVKYGDNESTLNCSEGVALTSEGKDFYVAVEPATDADLSVTFYTAEGKIAKKERKSVVTLTPREILAVTFPLVEDNWEVIPVTGVSIEPSSTSIEVGDTLRLAATITPENAMNKEVTWSSSNDEIVSVDDTGKLTAIAFGSATITVTTKDGAETATCEVTVTETKTMSELLATNLDIPEVEDMTPPANAWVNSTDTGCKAFIGVDKDGDKLFIFEKITQIDTVYFGSCMDDVFNRIDENTYKYVEEEVATVTVKMTGGKFTSCECSFDITELQALYGTYASPVAIPAGALSGGFTINAQGKKVHFSQGNLWYGKVGGATDATFQFEDKQYEFHGYDSVNNTWGLYGWVGASSTQFSSPEIYGVSTDNTQSYGSGNNEALKADWGKAIDNKATWRTLTIAEWQYLFAWNPELNGEGDFDSTSPRYNLFNCGVTVCGKENCVVLLPDAWKWEGTVGKGWQTVYPATSTDESPVTWEVMEKAGAVCLPAAGYRVTSIVYEEGNVGMYWSSSTDDGETAYNVFFNSSNVSFLNTYYRWNGFSVRLVTDVPAE